MREKEKWRDRGNRAEYLGGHLTRGGAHLPKHKYERPMISTVIVGLTGAAPSVRVPDEHRLQASHKG